MAAKRNKRQRRLLKQRRQTQRLLNPKPKQLRRERKAMARLEYRPVIKAAQDQIRISRTAQKQLNQFYGNYRGAIAKSADRADANTQRLYDQSRDTAKDLADRYDNKINTLAAEDAKSAELRGAQADSSNQQRSLAGESQRQNLMAADSKLLSQLGSASSAYLRNVALASRQGQRLDNRRERNTRQNARNDIRDARKERNAKVNALRGEQRQAEREWRLQKRTLAGKSDYNDALRDQTAGGVRQAELYSSASRRQARAKERAARINARGNRGGGGGGGSGYSRAEASSMLRATLAKKGFGWRDVAREPQVAIDALVNRGVSRGVARRAVKRYIRRSRGPRPGSKAWAKKNKQRSGR